MADDLFFTGFEGGARDALAAITAGMVFVDDGTAKTGQFHLVSNITTAAANSGHCSGDLLAAGISIGVGATTNGRLRVFIRLDALPSGNAVHLCGFGTSDVNNSGFLVVNTDGKFRAKASTTLGTVSANAMVVGVWYEIQLLHQITAGITLGTINTVNVSVNVLNPDGTQLDIVTAAGTSPAGSPSFLAPSLGHNDAVSSSYKVSFDDWTVRVQDSGSATLPNASRVSRVDPISNTTLSTWTGDYRRVVDTPKDATAGDEQSTATVGADTKFFHDSATTLQIAGVEAVKVYAHLKVAVGSTEAVLLNDVQHDKVLTAAYTTRPYFAQLWSVLTDTQFNVLTFGARNLTGASMQLGQCYVEVLHAGNPVAPSSISAYNHKVIKFTKTTDYQAITGIGFRPQVILIKKMTGTSWQGALKTEYMGGTRSKVFNTVAYDTRAIMYIQDDGFLVGPALENTLEYVALCIQDGGSGIDCKHLRHGAYVGNGVDSRNVTVKAAWSPNFVFIAATVAAVFRSSDNVGDQSTPLSGSTTDDDLIQSLLSDGFQVGTTPNTEHSVFHYWAMKVPVGGLKGRGFDYGSFVGDNTTKQVDTPLMTPDFIIANMIDPDGFDARWFFSQAHLAPNSSIWLGVTQSNTGITGLTTELNGFIVGNNLSRVALRTDWVAFSENGGAGTGSIEIDAGPDQVVNALVPVTLAPVVVSTFLCGVVVGSYHQLSGPPGGVGTIVGNQVTPNKSGVYTFRYNATDGINSLFDDVQITWQNAAPVVSAGPDQTIGSLVATLAGTVSDDGLPSPSVLTKTWTKISGPGTVIFSDPSVLTPTATASMVGTYVLEFSVTDGDQTSADRMTLVITEAAVADCSTTSPDPALPNCG